MIPPHTTTGEHPLIPIGQSTPVTIGLVASLLVVVATGVSGYTKLNSEQEYQRTEMATLRKGMDSLREAFDQQREVVTGQELRIRLQEDNNKRIYESIGELKADVRRALQQQDHRSMRGR